MTLVFINRQTGTCFEGSLAYLKTPTLASKKSGEAAVRRTHTQEAFLVGLSATLSGTILASDVVMFSSLGKAQF